MWKLSKSLASVSDQMQRNVEEWKRLEREAWVAEVTDPATGRVVPLDGWKRRYEGAKDPLENEEERRKREEEQQKKAEEDKSDQPGLFQKRAIELLTESVRSNLMSMLLEVLSKLLRPAERAIQAVDEDLASFLNAINGVVLTFRFEYVDEEKFRHIRSVCADRIAMALGAALEKQATRLGVMAEQMDEEALAQVTDAVSGKIVAEIESRQDEAINTVKTSPVFAMVVQQTGMAAQAEDSINELQNMLRVFLRGQLQHLSGLVREVVNRMLRRAAVFLNVIRTRAAAHVALQARLQQAGSAGGGAAAEQSPEEIAAEAEFNVMRQQVLVEIEAAHAKVNALMGHYVKRLVFMVSGLQLDELPPGSEPPQQAQIAGAAGAGAAGDEEEEDDDEEGDEEGDEYETDDEEGDEYETDDEEGETDYDDDVPVPAAAPAAAAAAGAGASAAAGGDVPPPPPPPPAEPAKADEPAAA